MSGVNLDTSSTGGGYYNGTNIAELAALALVFGDGIGRKHDYGYDKSPCCSPATCEQVNDVDRDVIKCSNDVDRDVLKGNFDVQKDIWTTDRDILLSAKDVKEDICESTHKIEKDIWDTDKDVLLGFKSADHKIDMLKCDMKEGFAEIKGEIKNTALCQELREEKRYSAELARKLEKADDTILKKDIVAEILAALGTPPVIAAR